MARSKKTFRYNGIEYRSGFEVRVAKALAKLGIEFEYEPYKLVYYKKKIGSKCGDCGSTNIQVKAAYTPDFVLANGIIIEAKGRFTSENRTRMLGIIGSNPDLDIRMCFQYDNWLTKKKAKKYSGWCEQKGIKYCIGTLQLKEFLQ